MTELELREQLETDLTWRKEEIIFLKNQIENILNNDDKNKYRKSLVLMLYSHFEGFTKICLLSYVQYLNQLGLKCAYVKSNIAAASMEEVFKAYDNLDRKNNIFRNNLPEDNKLHKLCRRVDFIEQLAEFNEIDVQLSDTVIDTESNLWYFIFQKNLYKVGLPLNLFEQYKGNIDGLVHRRNSIAHGSERAGVSESEFTKWYTTIMSIMEDIIMKIYNAARNRNYLK